MAMGDILSNMTDHQAMMLEMLKDFDAVCRKHDIKYQLFAGTALGAVRHGGFIPWDDDVDVILLRSEYERFFEEASADLDLEKYYVQREFGEHWPMQFSKLRRNNTACIEKYHPKDKQVHQGVYIDIFPCDNLSDNRIIRYLQFAASKVVIAKSLYARGYETNNIVKKAFMQLCRPIPTAILHKLCIREKDASSKMVHSFFAAARRYGKNIYPREWITESIQLSFEDGIFPVSKYYDQLLTTLYDDYNIPPRPEERICKTHACILDLHNSYERYIEAQNDMEFETLSRSIR